MPGSGAFANESALVSGEKEHLFSAPDGIIRFRNEVEYLPVVIHNLQRQIQFVSKQKSLGSVDHGSIDKYVFQYQDEFYAFASAEATFETIRERKSEAFSMSSLLMFRTRL